MRTLKLMFVAIAFTMSAAVYANPSSDYGRKGASVSEEIQNLLDESNLVIEESFKVRVIFSLSEDKKIRIHSVTSPNEEVNQFIEERLTNRQLFGARWQKDKIYELPVKVEAGS